MCLIIVKKPGIKFNAKIYEAIRESAKSNKDSFGYALLKPSSNRHENMIKVVKHIGKIDEFILKLQEEQIAPTDTLVVHLRMATHGPVTLTNCQPISVLNSMTSGILDRDLTRLTFPIMAHNGILSGTEFTKNNDLYSDSVKFAQELLGPRERTAESKSTLEIMYAIKKNKGNNMEHFRTYMHKFPMFAGNRIVTLCPKNGLLIIGKGWYEDSHGNLYSTNSTSLKKTLVDFKKW